MQSYTYIAIHKQSGYFYYGVRLSNKTAPENDIGKVYFTSSKTVKQIVESEGADSFEWIIRKKFDKKDEAVRWEYKVIRRMLNHPKILNKAVSPVNVPGNWFTNGSVNILGKYCPKGYYPGRTYTETPARKILYESQKLNRWWNNGSSSVFTQIPPSPEWLPGRLKQHTLKWNGRSLKSSKWWNNGQVNYRGTTPPDGFVRGRLSFETTKSRRPRTKEENDSHSKMMKSKRWWNNGKENSFSEECPPSFVPGRIMRPS